MTATTPVDQRRQLAVNAAAGGIANIVKVGTQLILLPLMARLLGPVEFGLYALALPTISFFTVLADGGLGQSLAREDESETAVWSTSFWVLLSSCTFIALVVCVFGYVLANLSQQPRLTGIMALLSTSFILLALSILPAARLVRRGNLVYHSVGDLIATLVGAALALILANLGAGAWSLAVQYVAAFLLRTLILNYGAFALPTFEFDLAGLWPHIATGGSIIGSRLSEFAGRLLENLLYGRMFGPAALGTFTFANQASRFLCEAAANPLWSALYSHAIREDIQKIGPLHNALARLLASVLFPCAFLLAASAPEVLDVALGSKWAGAAVQLEILVPFYVINVVAAQCGAILLAKGRSATMFWVLSGLSLGRILAVAAGFWIGQIGIAWGIGLANVMFAGFIMSAMAKEAGSSIWPLIGELVAPLGCSIVAGCGCYGLISLHPGQIGWAVASLLLGGCLYLICMAAIQGPRMKADFVAIGQIVRSRRA